MIGTCDICSTDDKVSLCIPQKISNAAAILRGETKVTRSYAGTNLWDAQQTVDTIMEDFPPSLMATLQQKHQSLQTYLQTKSAQVVNFNGYCRIDKHEVEQGLKVGKPREKVTNIQEMLQLSMVEQVVS